MKTSTTTLVQSLQRAITVLEAVAREKDGVGVSEVSRKVGLDKSTTYRMLHTLAHHGYLSKNGESGRYQLGLKLLELGRSVGDTLDVRNKARPYLQQLMEASQETVYLGVLQDGEIFYLDSVESNQPVRMVAARFGKRAALHSSALGKVLLAYLPGKLAKEILSKIPLKAFTKNTITDRKMLELELEKTRRRGYAIDDRESSDQCRCIAAPVRDYSGEVVAAVSISAPANRFTLKKLEHFRRLLTDTTGKISQDLGH